MAEYTAESFFTRGRIAKAFGLSPTRVSYVLNFKDIAPDFRAGSTRVYGPAQVERILRELTLTSGRPAPGRKTAASTSTPACVQLTTIQDK
jgi:hypothetical protein